MPKLTLCFCLSFCLLSTAITAESLHKFYVSVTQLNCNMQDGSIQGTTKIFFDDLENALSRAHGRPLRLCPSVARKKQKTDAMVYDYLREKLSMSVDGKPLPLEFLSCECDVETVIVRFRAEGAGDFSSLHVSDVVLMELFNEQRNVIQSHFGDVRRSTLLSRGRESVTIERPEQ